MENKETVEVGCLPVSFILSLCCYAFRNLDSLDSRRVKVTVVVDNLETTSFKGTMPQNIVSSKSGHNGGIDL